MAKPYDAMKKSNSHMNGFGQFDISNGHKAKGKAPYSSDPSTNSLSPSKEGSSKKKMKPSKTDSMSSDMDIDEA